MKTRNQIILSCIGLFVIISFIVTVYSYPEQFGLIRPYSEIGEYDGMVSEIALMINEQCLDKNKFKDYPFTKTSNGHYYIDNVNCEMINVEQGGCLEPFSKGYPNETCNNRVTFDSPYGETGPHFSKEFCNQVKSWEPALTDTVENKRVNSEWLHICTIRGLIDDETVLFQEQKNETIFHGKSLSYWQNLDEYFLVQYYENFGKSEGNFFEDLGKLLIKSHSQEELDELGIDPASEIDVVWTGIRSSLPPRMGFDAKVNSTDGKSYRITGTIHGNVILDNFQIVEDNGRRIGWTPAFDYNRVQINGTTALQICSILEIACMENPVWDAVHRHDKDFTYFYYDTYDIESNVQIGEHYIQITKNQICHSFEDLSSQQISELECQEIRK